MKLTIRALFLLIIGGFLNLLAFGQKQVNFDYDVVIVGGGMAGLSAAYDLANYKILVLEKENRLGGRVQTIAFDSLITLDMGAAFAFESELIPFEYKLSPIIDEFYQMALVTNDTVVYGTHPQHCLKNLGWSEEKMKKVQQYDSKNGMDFSQFSSQDMEIINSFNSLVAAGDIRNYNPKRQLDAFKQWSVNHYTSGNQQIVNAFASKMEGDLAINAEVKSVEAMNGGGVRIVFETEGQLRQVTALSAIITTPPKVSNQIIMDKNKVAQNVLDNIVSFPYLVAGVVLKDDVTPPFKWAATPNFHFSNVLQQKTLTKDKRVYLFNFTINGIKEIAPMKHKEIIDYCLESLGAAFDVQIEEEQILFSVIKFWEHSAVLVDSDYYNRWSDELFEPLPGVFLAGDWLDLYGFPNGIKAAIQSGQRAAKQTQLYLQIKE